MHGRSVANPVIVATLICGSMAAKTDGVRNSIICSPRARWVAHCLHHPTLSARV